MHEQEQNRISCTLKKMKLCVLGLVLFISFISTASTCPVCCSWYLTTTEQPPSNPSTANNCSCQLTLKKLIDLKSNETDKCLTKELIFQSGVHYVQSDSTTLSQTLDFRNLVSVVVRGHDKTTIKCLNQSLSLRLYDVLTIRIQNLHIDKCRNLERFYSIEDYHAGLHINIKYLPFAQVEIVNSTFTDTVIMTFVVDNEGFSGTLTIENTVIEHCNSSLSESEDILQFYSLSSSTGLSIELRHINVSYNDREFLRFSGFRDILITFTGYNYFAHNRETLIESYYNSRFKLHFSKTEVYFINNSQTSNIVNIAPIHIHGGGTILFQHSKVSFINNRGGLTAEESNITIADDTTIKFINNNMAGEGDGSQRSSFIKERVAIYADSGTVLSFQQCNVLFKNSQGALVADDARIIFNDNVTIQFSNNNGLPNGGAMSLDQHSIILFNASRSKIVLSFMNNTAERGGAIYVANFWIIRPVFDIRCDPSLVQMTFSNNSALYGGHNIYGGWVDWIRDGKSGNISYNYAIGNMLNFKPANDSGIASCPIRICLCKDDLPDCTISNYAMQVYGYSVKLSLVAVGERYTPTPAYVEANLESDSRQDQWLLLEAKTERLQASCTKVTYLLDSKTETVHFKPKLPTCNSRQESLDDSLLHQYHALFEQLSIEFNSIDCPFGFTLHRIRRTCICRRSLGLKCDETTTTINREEQQWIGVTHKHVKPDEPVGVIIYSPCPFDYCRIDNRSLFIQLEYQDVLCAFNRSGILCGGCKTNFSRVLGSSRCKKCRNNFLVMIAIFFGQILFGLIVVISLIVLDLTVAVGTINGLTFYANIIRAQHAIFFESDSSSSFLSMFIARLNLDEGIETCLYDGLDEYAITWLKIPLPLYMWLFAGILILLSRYSSRFSKLVGKNSVQVLATLFLISYTRLLQLIISVFSFVMITYPDGYREKVWLADGNVEYLKGKHIPLFFVTALFLLVSLPYTAILLTIQLLYKMSHFRVMFWVQRLKPFFDAYTGPYKAPHRYWTGLLLVLRIFLLTIFSTFQSSNPSINLLSIIFISFALVGWISLVKGVYESSLNNLLEVTFLINLGMTSAAVLFDKHNTRVAIYVSTSTAFVFFVCIIFYHTVKWLLLTKLGSKVKGILLSLAKLKDVGTANRDTVLGRSQFAAGEQVHLGVTSTTVELKEPLLEDERDV